MMIYNTVDYPIAIEIGDKTYFMERDSELELRLSSGTYDYRLYKADQTDGPLPMHYEMETPRWHTITVCYAETGKLTCKRSTKVYIREDFIELFNEAYFWRRRHAHYRTYNASVFNLTVEDGELSDRRQGCLNEQVYNEMLAPYKSLMWMLGAAHIIFLVLAALFGFGVFAGLHHTVSYTAMAGCLFAQVVLIDTDLKKLRLLRALKSVPVLVDVQDFLRH